MRRFSIWAIVTVIALVAIWSALWVFVRGYAETQIDRVLANSGDGNPAISCSDRTIGGFPFRLKLACSPAAISVDGGRLGVDINQLDVTAMAYNPQHVVAEYTAPLTVSLPTASQPFRAEWSQGISSARITGQGFSIFSTLFENLDVTGPRSAFKTNETQFHARPLAEEGVTDLAFSADNVEISLDGQTTAPFHLAMTLRVNATPQHAMAGAFAGGQAELQNIDIRFWHGASEIVATGNLFLSDDGLANGELEIAAKNLKDLAAFLQTLPGQVSTPAQQTVGYLISIGRPGKDANGDPVSQLKLTIRDNDIYAGDRLIASIQPAS